MGEAINLTNKLYPGLLEKDSNLMFALKCRQFVEMVNGTDSEIYYHNENQTSVIQSTKSINKSSNTNLEEINCNNINGLCSESLLNGHIDDIEMKEDPEISTSNLNTDPLSYQKNISTSNGLKSSNRDEYEMGKFFCKIYHFTYTQSYCNNHT